MKTFHAHTPEAISLFAAGFLLTATLLSGFGSLAGLLGTGAMVAGAAPTAIDLIELAVALVGGAATAFAYTRG